MSWPVSLGLLLGLLAGLLALGLPVVFAFLIIDVVGAWIFLGGDAGLMQMTANMAESITQFSLVPIALFVMMGEVLFHTGVAFRAIAAIERLIAAIPGRLSVVGVLGGTAFATLSGSSLANTAMMGSTLLPDMLERGYNKSIAMGPLMATGGIAMLIPPSALAVMLGSLAHISIERLLIGGILPGLIMGLVFLLYVVGRCALDPTLAPAEKLAPVHGWARWRPFMVDVLPLFSIFVVVVGSMIMGWASPSESAALGAIACIIIAACYRALTLRTLAKSLTETAKVSVMILFILVASTTYSQILSFSGATSGLLAAVGQYELTPMIAVLGMLAILIFLGCFVDQISMIMITLPFFMPLAQSLGIDLVWLGILFLVVMEIGLLTPPFGLLLVVMQGVAPKGTRFVEVYRAALPFLALEFLVLALVIVFPGLATWLPSLIPS